MELKNDLCAVSITTDSSYIVQSANNKFYQLELNPENYKAGDEYNTFSIHVNRYYDEIDIALVGNLVSYTEDCAVLNGNILTVLQDNTITQIDIMKPEMVLHKDFDIYGCSFGLFQIPKGYIIHGEIEIVRLDLNFNRVWGFCARDIFVSQSGEKSFELCENSIKLLDWGDSYYELDFDGNQINI